MNARRMTSLLIGTLGVTVAMVLAMLASHVSPLVGFSAFFVGAFGGEQQIAETLVSTTALLFPALGIAIAFRAGLFNIGAEGQLLIGGLFAGWIGTHLTLPPFFGIAVIFLAGALGGALWASIAGWLKAYRDANEVISTLMLNFIATSVALYLVTGPLRAADAAGPELSLLPHAYWLPTLLAHTRLTIALPIALLAAWALAFLLKRSVVGYQLRAVGEAPEAARRAGISLRSIALLAMACSGALAGMGGAALVAGELHRFNTQLSPGYGFIAIAVALVGGLEPPAICLAALAFGALESGGLALQAAASVPKDAIHVIEGLLVFALSARRYLGDRGVRTR
ncbi:MAG TPA: ABC transporter permease [Candidatus Dormibacteraeota bacterium]|nr:ABC transporter permease [Candidatus Dormibacteraeota bacterium]